MILLLGASSYVGQHIYGGLSSASVIATHNSKPVSGSIHFDVTRMDLASILPEGADVTHALILYAETRLDACKADLKRSYELNVSSTKKVIDQLVDRGIKPIFTSSEYVFDGEKGGYTEDDPAHPTTVYGSQKVEIEQYLDQRCPDYATLRLAKVFGTDPNDRTILSGWLDQIRDGEEIRCARDQVYSPIHIDDVVASANAAVRLNLSGVYHVANPKPWSRLGMLRALLSAIKADANVVECSIRDFDFLDNRPLDLSMEPGKIMEAASLQFKTVPVACAELSDRM